MVNATNATTGTTYSHGGDVGDLIYACPLLKALARTKHAGDPVDVVLYPASKVRSPATPESAERIGALLRVQPYIRSVRFEYEPQGTSLDRWRNWYPGNSYNLATAQLTDYAYAAGWAYKPWLTVNDRLHGTPRVVFHRSPRYHNPEFPWLKLYHVYREEAVFVGVLEEHDAFQRYVGGKIHYHPTPDFLALARIIAGAKLFIGNQSAPYAIAEGLKQNTVQETFPGDANCLFPRGNAVYGLDANTRLPNLEDL